MFSIGSDVIGLSDGTKSTIPVQEAVAAGIEEIALIVQSHDVGIRLFRDVLRSLYTC